MLANAEILTTAFIQGVGSTELLIIFFVILLLFGAKKLPELARGMGKSIREFKKATSEIEDDFRSAMDVEEKSPPAGEKEKSETPAPEKEQSKT